MRRKKEKIINGEISFGSYGKAFLTGDKEGDYEIYVSKKNTNRAFPGDLVSLKIKYSIKIIKTTKQVKEEQQYL